MWVSYDGNFANSRKAKKVDKDDVCLSDGLQYYVKNEAYEEWAGAGGKEREVCLSHRVLELGLTGNREAHDRNVITIRLERAIPTAPGVG